MQNPIDNNLVGISPQKLGGAALPSHPEKKVANVVRNSREKKLTVIREDVI